MRPLLFVLGIACSTACGGAPKTAIHDGASAAADEGAPKWDTSSESAATAKSEAAAPSGGGGTTASPGLTPSPAVKQRSSDEYDKDSTEIVLKRAARQVKDNCGHAKDEDGKVTGPFGKASVTIVLGHNGHSKGATLGAPFEGTPPGRCILQAFSNLTFPPWSGPDTTVSWDVEIAPPAK